MSNRYLRTLGTSSHAVEQRVEWCAKRESVRLTSGVTFATPSLRMYAFDVHCNSFFPVFVALYGA